MSKNIVLTHRYGDLCMILPLAKYWASGGETVRWVVHSMFADIFDGISYVKPEVWHGDASDAGLEDSIMRATQNQWDGEIMVPRNKADPQHWNRCSHLSADFWLNCDSLELYHELPLVFDRRNPEREARLLTQHFPEGIKKPILAYNMAGKSFNFAGGGKLMETVIRMNQDAGSPYELMNLAAYRAERVFDLIGLLEHADVLLTVDTLTVHLAHATNTPTVVIVPDCSHASPEPRYHWIETIRNSEALSPAGMSLLQGCLFASTSSRRKAARGRLMREPEEMLLSSATKVWCNGTHVETASRTA